MTIFYCLRFETASNWRARSSYLYPQGTLWPKHWVPFSSPPTTRRVTVEVLEPLVQSQSQSYVTTDSQSASLSWNKASIWGLIPDHYYCQTVSGCWCGALSLKRGWVCLLPESQITISSSSFFVTTLRGQNRKHRFQQDVFTNPLLRNG
jgi:hypothetical protein